MRVQREHEPLRSHARPQACPARGHRSARRAHAAPHPRGVRRATASPRSRQAAPHVDRERRPRLDHLLGPSRRRQDHPRQDHRRTNPLQLHRILRRPLRHQRNQAGHGRCRKSLDLWLAHHPLRRRNPPLQQSPAGRFPALRRARIHPPHRRNHRKPVLRNHLRAALPLPRLNPASANRRATHLAAPSRAQR